MFRTFLLRALPAVLAVSLAACSAESSGDAKEVADLRAELQRTKQVADKQREQIVSLERRISTLAEDVARVHKASEDIAAAPGAKPGDAAAATNAAGDPAAANGAAAGATTSVSAPAMKAYFESEEGKKTFAAALKVQQDEADKERSARAVDGLLARLAKDANLTEDQSKKMKDILTRGATQLAELRQSLQGGAGFADPDVRQKFTDLRTNTDNEVKAVLSQTQYDTYQKSMGSVFGGFGGAGGFGGRPRGGQGGGSGN
jgi:hypothetical protein